MKLPLTSLVLSAVISLSGCSQISKNNSEDFEVQDRRNPAISKKADIKTKTIEGTIIEELFEAGYNLKEPIMVKGPGEEWRRVSKVPDRYAFVFSGDDGTERCFVIEGEEAKEWNENYNVGSRIEIPLDEKDIKKPKTYLSEFFYLK
jgi:hypothetical protein